MKEEQENLQPESIDQVIEGGELSAHDPQMARLIQHLHTYTQEHARENERSLGRIWNHMAQSQKHPVFLPPEWKQPGGRRIFIKERKVMEDTKISNRMSSPVEGTQPKKRNSLFRVVGLSLVAAVALITILSFTLFSNILHPTSQVGNEHPSSVTGSKRPLVPPTPTVQPQPSILPTPTAQPQQINPKLACSFAYKNTGSINGLLGAPSLAWSSQGQLAVATYLDLKVFSAKNCDTLEFSQPFQQSYNTQWSPNGEHLAIPMYDGQAIYIVDRTGKTSTHLSFAQLGALGVIEIRWSSDSNRLIFTSQDTNDQESIKSVDLSNGNKVTTLLTLPTDSVPLAFSPNGKFVLVEALAKNTGIEVWDISSGKKVSTLDSTSPKPSGWAFSPDGSQLALDGKIYDTASGTVLASFNTASNSGFSNVAWSPDGKYLAQATNTITIYDVNAKRAVATFGKIDAQYMIVALAWAPDSNGLASLNMSIADSTASSDLVNVWKLN